MPHVSRKPLARAILALWTAAGFLTAAFAASGGDPVPLGVEETQLTASDGAAQNFFGTAAAIAGDTALIGARGNELFRGGAYLFTRDGDGWSEQLKLVASDGESNHQFGSSVALSADTAVAGTPNAVVDGNFNQGAAYVFVRNGDGWVEQAKLVADDGAEFDVFGNSVAIAGDTILVAARDTDVEGNANQGAVYVFTRTAGAWSQQAKLTADDGTENAQFGGSVALSGGTALVGAAPATVNGTTQGAAYVFTRTEGAWSQQAKLTAGDGAENDQLGTSVALLGDTALVGAWTVDVDGHANQGAAYVFTRDGEVWSEQAKLVAADGAADDLFGSAVAVAGDTALVGALATVDGNVRQGAVYVFTRSGDAWSEHAKLTASDGVANDRLGSTGALDISGDTWLAGAPEVTVEGNDNQGAAYVFLSDLPAQAPHLDVDPESLSTTLAEGQEEIRSLTLTNLGGETLEWEVTQEADCALPAWVSVAPATGVVPGVSSQGVAVTFDATDLEPGDYDAELCLASNDPQAPSTPVPLALTVPGDPEPGVLEVDPAALDFGEVPVGSAEALSFTVINAPAPGAGDLELATLEVTSGAPEFAITGGDCAAGTVLPPEGTCTVEVTFQPVSSGKYSGAVTVTTTDEQSATVELEGSAPAAPPAIDVEPKSLATTLPPDATETLPLTVHNLGEAVLDWRAAEAADATGGTGGDVTITHSESLEIQTPHTVACQTPPFTRENHYLRTFALDEFGLSEGLVVSEVTFGVEILDIPLAVEVNLYTLTGDFVFANLTPIGGTTVELEPQNLTLITVPVTGFAPAGSTLVVDIAAPDLLGEGRFFPGSNDLGESAPSYNAASACARDEPEAYEDFGFPGIHLVMTVGGHEPPDCTLPSWVSVDPVSGSVPGGDSQTIDITFDTAGLLPGDRQARLCLGSNDPAHPLTSVPLALTVTGGGESFTAAGLRVDPQELASEANGLFEPGETVDVAPAWRNDGELAASLGGTASNFTGPEGAAYSIDLDAADYGLIEPDDTASCLDTEVCYRLGLDDPAARPAEHWDATFDETLDDTDGTAQTWTLHIGASFADVPSTSPFYPAIETLLHSDITGGCAAGAEAAGLRPGRGPDLTAGTDGRRAPLAARRVVGRPLQAGGAAYCPGGANSRAQMPVFMLRALEGADYTPPPCVEDDPPFGDVPFDSPFCPWIQDLAGHGVVSGCGNGDYCPGNPVTRAQMSIFLLKTLEGAGYEPPTCTNRFTDVPCPSLFADWIENLAARGITGGCTATEYCPGDAVTRAQMAVFVTRTFGLTLYGP